MRIDKVANERLAKVWLEKHTGNNSYKTYSIGKKVFVRLGKTGGKILTG